MFRLTLLNTIFLGALVVLGLGSGGDALNALVVVVLSGPAGSGLGAL